MAMYCSGTANAGRVKWEVVGVGSQGYKLTMQSTKGTVVEYFSSPAEAMARQAQLEEIVETFWRNWPTGMTIGNC